MDLEKRNCSPKDELSVENSYQKAADRAYSPVVGYFRHPTDGHFESGLEEFDPVLQNREPESLQDENTDINGPLGWGGGNPSGLIPVFSSRENFKNDLCERESTVDEFDALWKVVLTWLVLTLQHIISHTLPTGQVLYLHFYYQTVSKSLLNLEEMKENQGPHQWLLAHCAEN
ncbi:hypothetical protein TNCV_456191 [Trichonephila clavipes]|nr:hypothetical protein TNCV_456191 [Trichonephila clavipes]